MDFFAAIKEGGMRPLGNPVVMNALAASHVMFESIPDGTRGALLTWSGGNDIYVRYNGGTATAADILLRGSRGEYVFPFDRETLSVTTGLRSAALTNPCIQYFG